MAAERYPESKDFRVGHLGRRAPNGGRTHPHQQGRPARHGTIHLVLGMIWVLAVIAAASNLRAGAGLLLSVNAMLALMDWHAFISLGGLLDWKRLGVAAKVGLSLILLTGCVAPPTIIARALREAWETTRHKSA